MCCCVDVLSYLGDMTDKLLKWDSSAEAPLEVLGVMSVCLGLRQGRIIIIHVTFKEIMVKKLFYVAGQDTGTTEWCNIPIAS